MILHVPTSYDRHGYKTQSKFLKCPVLDLLHLHMHTCIPTSMHTAPSSLPIPSPRLTPPLPSHPSKPLLYFQTPQFFSIHT